MHYSLSEYGIVVWFMLLVALDRKERQPIESQLPYPPPDRRYQLKNPVKFTLHPMEVQSGRHFGECSIDQLQDPFGNMHALPLAHYAD